MSDRIDLPTPGQWVRSALEGQGMAIAALGRAIGRDRTIVQRWVSGREQIPRPALGDIVREVGERRDFRYLMALKDVEDYTDQLQKPLKELTKRTGLQVEFLTQSVRNQAKTRADDENAPDLETYAELLASNLSDAAYVFRQWSEAAKCGEFSSLLTPDTINRHLRYPVNHFVGLALNLGRDGGEGFQELRQHGIVSLRSAAKKRPADGPDELVRHHALHILGRYGDAEDRAVVDDVITDARLSADPLCRRLGWVGLILSSDNDELQTQYLRMLQRDDYLARADLFFDAIHYGDAKLTPEQCLPTAVHQFERSVANLLRHMEQPERYRNILDLDCLRLLEIFGRTGPQLLGRPDISLRLCHALMAMAPLQPASPRRRLQRLVIGQLSPSIAHEIGRHELRSTEAQTYDVFIAYNSLDLDQVKEVVRALRRRGVRTWMDHEDLPPGVMFQAEMDKVLSTCQSAAVFVGRSGIGPWEILETRVAITQFVERGIPVIPVMLDGTMPGPIMPVFLRELRVVDMRGPDDIDDLVWGITGIKS